MDLVWYHLRNIGDNNALFKPVHGSAPDIAGLGISNPSAMVLSAVMMMDYLGESYEARNLKMPLLDVLREGNVLTPDLWEDHQKPWKWHKKSSINFV